MFQDDQFALDPTAVLQWPRRLPEPAIRVSLKYNGTTPETTAQVSLLSERGDPLLATWQYGLGKGSALRLAGRLDCCTDLADVITDVIRSLKQVVTEPPVAILVCHEPGRQSGQHRHGLDLGALELFHQCRHG